MSAQSCVVLGATGFIGSAIAAEAERRGWAVIGVSSKTAAEVVGRSCDVLINANGNSRKYLARQDPALDFDLSVRTVSRSLHEIRAARYVYLSSSEVYRDSSDPRASREDASPEWESLSAYGFHKRLAETLVRRYAPRWTILRLSGLLGPGLRKNAVYDLLTGAPWRLSPDSAFQFLDTRVLARRLFDLLERPESEHGVFNVAGRGVVSLREIAAWAGAPLPDGNTLPTVRCEISTERISTLFELPATAETARDFVRAWRAQGAIP